MAEGRRTARKPASRSATRSAGRASGRPIGARRRRDEAVEIVREEGPSGPLSGERVTSPVPAVESASRVAQLRQAVTGLRTRAASADVERWLLVAGGILMPLGVVVIVLGWQGASNTPYAFEQTPYVISGGLLGVGLMIVGGFLYFGYWLTRVVREQRGSADRIADALERMEELLGGGATAGNGQTAARSSGRRAAGSSPFVVTPEGSMFHRPDCVVVEGKSGLRRVTGREKGVEPCGICDPLAA